MSLRGATINHSPWSRRALSPETWAVIGVRTLALRAHMNIVGGSPSGPWVVRVWTAGQSVEHRGWGLEDICSEALDRFAAGVDTRYTTWRAGSDGLGHGQVGPRPMWTLCQRPALGETYTHPERARCVSCLRALDASPVREAVSA